MYSYATRSRGALCVAVLGVTVLVLQKSMGGFLLCTSTTYQKKCSNCKPFENGSHTTQHQPSNFNVNINRFTPLHLAERSVVHFCGSAPLHF